VDLFNTVGYILSRDSFTTHKRKVKNKARVEGSICETYIIEETTTFYSYYFETHIHSRRTRVQRNDDGCEADNISIFNHYDFGSGECKIH